MLSLRKSETPAESPAKTPVATQTQSILDRYPTPDTGRSNSTLPLKDSLADDGPTDFVIGRGTRLKGEIDAQGDVIVEGEVEASIRAATMRIDASGSVKGDAHVANAEIRGRFEGTLHVRECLTVCGDGDLAGSIRYGELKVDKGGRISGDVALVDEASKKPVVQDAKPNPYPD
jgi:cytoskeletal protein CcmA (bactofilin family)